MISKSPYQQLVVDKELIVDKVVLINKDPYPGIEMSVSVSEGGQDYDDILGFPGDGFKDKDDVNPVETLLRPGNRLWMVVTEK